MIDRDSIITKPKNLITYWKKFFKYFFEPDLIIFWTISREFLEVSMKNLKLKNCERLKSILHLIDYCISKIICQIETAKFLKTFITNFFFSF